ncbi:helix-turn-helix domain-containing protein [Paenibacillus sp. GCM10023252]|uniref:helix-turn-helix domain-containing protein n=1 Tax=Paenibacillus sp. GCM10023252 TaxID=3252649 RepID=UPI00362251C5
MSQIARTIGENIRKLRKGSGFSQEQLALRADINASYMGQVERGEKSPTVDVLSKIASALGVPLEQLVAAPGSSAQQDSGYEDKIAHQLSGLTMREKESVYRFVKHLVQFKEME